MLLLVTGATGLVGNNVVRLALARGMDVRVLSRPTSDPRPCEGLAVERMEGDICDADSVWRAVQGVSLVVHAAAHVHIGWSGANVHRTVNVEGTRNVAEAAEVAGVRMVHVSSVDALGLQPTQGPADEQTPPDDGCRVPYVVSKRAAEREVLHGVHRGLSAVLVEPAFMLGPWDWKPSSGRMLLAVGQGQALLAPRGGNDFCDVRDVADGILAAAERGTPGRRYILGGEHLSYYDAWRMFARVTGARAPWFRARPSWIKVAGWLGDAWGKITGHEPDVNSAATSMSALPHHFSSARATAELGYKPRPAEESARAAWEWFQEHGYVKGRRHSAKEMAAPAGKS